MKITIATGVYPPDIGGPSEYARQLYETLLIQNREVSVVTYADLRRFPTGLRHFFYFCKLWLENFDTDCIVALDTFSSALPAMIFSKILGKKIVVRVAGDFLWESYVERTKKPILLSQFYLTEKKFTMKESIIFLLTKWVLQSADWVVFSTEWQKNIMLEPYGLESSRIKIIENFFPEIEKEKEESVYEEKIFLSPSRDRLIKNKESIEKAFRHVALTHPEIVLDTQTVSREVLMEKIKKSYAVIVASFSEVSPNLVCDALQYGVPVIVTCDNGIIHRLEGFSVFVDPLSWSNIAEGIETLLDPTLYRAFRQKIKEIEYSHSWNEIAQEFLDILEGKSI